jgi:hypothetical protein
MSTVSIPEKTNLECSAVYLLDENFCLKNSVDVINNNFYSLSCKLVEIETAGAVWNQIYTKFQATSSQWLASSSHLQEYSDLWSGAYTCVKSLSATWNTEFSVYYPQIIDLTTFTSTDGSLNTSTFLPWLNKNFPASRYSLNQCVSLYFNISQIRPYVWTFYRSFYEPCQVAGSGINLHCADCYDIQGIRLHRGCNHHGGRAGVKACDNAYDYCTHVNAGAASVAGCPTYGSKKLEISYRLTSTDTITCSIRRRKFKNVNYQWIAI